LIYISNTKPIKYNEVIKA